MPAHINEAWRDRSLTLLLAIQLVTIFGFGVTPAAASGIPVPSSLAFLLLIVATALFVVVARTRWLLAGGVGALLFDAGLALYEHVRGEAAFALNVTSLVTFAMLSLVVGKAVFRPGPFTDHRIRGTVVLYLNLGLMFSLLHGIVAELIPGAYGNLPDIEHRAIVRAALDYYSFCTLTSVGYGDIVPIAPFARGLSTLEAVMGQLLPTLLIGRVLSLALRED